MKLQVDKEKKKGQMAEKRQKKQGSQQDMLHKKIRTEPISWKKSEAIQHMYGENSMDTKEKTTGLYDRQNEHLSNKKMKEVFRVANSYGNIAVGANKKQEAIVVISQTREHDEKTTEENQKMLHTERKKRETSSNGEILLNNSRLAESAWAYKGNTKVSEKRVIGEIKKYSEKEESKMLEKRMPFLLLEKDKKQIANLREQIRERYEKGDEVKRQILVKQKETLQHEMQQKEQNEKMMTNKIKFAWQKAQKIVDSDFDIRKGRDGKEKKKQEDLTEVPNLDENSVKKSEKDRNDYKNVDRRKV